MVIGLFFPEILLKEYLALVFCVVFHCTVRLLQYQNCNLCYITWFDTMAHIWIKSEGPPKLFFVCTPLMVICRKIHWTHTSTFVMRYKSVLPWMKNVNVDLFFLFFLDFQYNQLQHCFKCVVSEKYLSI